MRIKNIEINIVEIVSIFLFFQMLRALAIFEYSEGTEAAEAIAVFMLLYLGVEIIKYISNHKFFYIVEE